MARPKDDAKSQLARRYGEYLTRCRARVGLSLTTIAAQAQMPANKLQRMARGFGGPPSNEALAHLTVIFGEAFNPNTVYVDDSGTSASKTGAGLTLIERDRITESARRTIAEAWRVSPGRVAIDIRLP